MAEIISFCKGTGYLDTTIHNRMVIKRSYRKTLYMPIQKHWMAILPFTPQNFKLIIGDMKVRALMLQTNDKGQDFLHFKSMVRKSKCTKKNTIMVLKNNWVILKSFLFVKEQDTLTQQFIIGWLLKEAIEKHPYMPIQKQWMAILPFTPQNFKLIINEYCNWRETRKNIRFNVVQQWIYIYKS